MYILLLLWKYIKITIAYNIRALSLSPSLSLSIISIVLLTHANSGEMAQK